MSSANSSIIPFKTLDEIPELTKTLVNNLHGIAGDFYPGIFIFEPATSNDSSRWLEYRVGWFDNLMDAEEYVYLMIENHGNYVKSYITYVDYVEGKCKLS